MNRKTTRPRSAAAPRSVVVQPPGSARPPLEALPCHDASRMGALLHSFEPRFTQVALRVTRNAEASKDVVQSAYEKVMRNCERFRGGARVSTWIHRIVVNEALMWLRGERRQAARHAELSRGGELLAPDPAPTPLELLAAEQRRRRVRDAIAGLPGWERDVVMRGVLEERSFQALAAERGLPAATLKSRAFRARRRLRRVLSDLAPTESLPREG